jgi:PTH1 family peptidyl-tRNA hydrolase
MADPILLIVGLGNPGPKYDQTRHNAGFWFVDEVARRYHVQFRTESAYSSELCRVTASGIDVWLQKPMSFMNRSGLPIRQLAAFYKIPPQQILVVHDEIDLPPGTARLKHGGGHGGHNGLRDAISHIGQDFWRLRIGVGHPGQRDQVIDFVLGKPGKEEADLIHRDIEEAVELLPLWLAGEMDKAMQRLHSKRNPKES